MPARLRPLFLLALTGALLLAPPARADDEPPVAVDILAVLCLEPEDDATGLAAAHSLVCTVKKGSPLTMFQAGDAVCLAAFDRGSFHVSHANHGLTACCYIERVNLLDFLSPRRALEALGLEPSDEPIRDGTNRNTRVVDRERLARYGIPSDTVGDLASVYGRHGGRWSISTYGSDPGSVEFDAWAFYAPRAPLGDVLERVSVTLDLETLPEGGRLLAAVEDPARLEARGIRGMPSGGLVRLVRGAESVWTLTTLSPGFTCTATLEGLDLEALGLEPPRLEALPVGSAVRGRLQYQWKARKEGWKDVRGRDPVEVLRRPDGRYVLRGLHPRRPGSLVLPDDMTR